MLTAPAEQRTRGAISRDLFGDPGVRHDRKSEPDEECGIVRERTEFFETGRATTSLHLMDECATNPQRTSVRTHDERPHLGNPAAQGRQFCTPDHSPTADRDDESRRVHCQFVQFAWQKPSFFAVRLDERMECVCVAGVCLTNEDVRRPARRSHPTRSA
jgi:hypothetical protein